MDKSRPLVELFVKASTTDKTKKGSCLIGQQWFMCLYSLVERGLIDLRLTPMSLDLPPLNYVRIGAARHLPIAWIEAGMLAGEDASGKIISSTDSLETLMEKLKCPYLAPTLLKSRILEAEHAFEDLYRSLMGYIGSDKKGPLLNELHKLNQFLSSHSGCYLLGDELTYVDCQLMPKLQHLRVVGIAFKHFDIPETLTHVWSYIGQMYQTKAFVRSCPLDRDILLHYTEKYPLFRCDRLALMDPKVLTDIPFNVFTRSSHGTRYK